jgi:hypothetical protein
LTRRAVAPSIRGRPTPDYRFNIHRLNHTPPRYRHAHRYGTLFVVDVSTHRYHAIDAQRCA